MAMENVTNSDLFITGEKASKHFRPLFANRIYMSHPENKRSVYQPRYLEVNSHTVAPVAQSYSTSLPNLEDDKGKDCCTQTSKTILQLAELETGSLFPDSLTSSPTNYRNKKHEKNLNSCSENFDISVPYMRKRSVQNYIYDCYDTQKSPREENFTPYINASLTNTFLAKKRNEDVFPVCGCRSRFLQQTSPLRNLMCSPKSNIKSPTYFEPETSAYRTPKNNLAPCSRFTVKNIKNQESVEDVPPLVFWPNSQTIDRKVNKIEEKSSPKKLNVNRRGSSFMSPTIASEQRNQQRLVKSFDRLMSPTRRGRSLSPNRMSYMHSMINNKDNKIPFADDIQSQSSSYKPNLKKGSKHYAHAAKSSSLLSEYVTTENHLKTDLSNLNITSPQIQPSLPSSTTSTENLIFQIMTRIKDDDWSTSLKGLAEVSDCCRTMDTDLLYGHMTVVNQKLLQLLRSPRSHVCRTACQIAGHLFETMKDTRRPEFDDIVEALLSKTADSNKFIRKDANLSLDCMVTHIPIYHAVRSLCLKGPCHKNPLVRTATLRLVVCSVVIAGPDIILGLPGHEPTRKRIIRLFPQFLFDKHLETRKYGERLFKIFSKEHNFEYFLKKYVDSSDVSRINIILRSRILKR